MDIVKHIGDNSSLSAAQKVEFLDLLAKSWGYEAKVYDEEAETDDKFVTNPESKKDFVNRQILKLIKLRIKKQKMRDANEGLNTDLEDSI